MSEKVTKEQLIKSSLDNELKLRKLKFDCQVLNTLPDSKSKVSIKPMVPNVHLNKYPEEPEMLYCLVFDDVPSNDYYPINIIVSLNNITSLIIIIQLIL